MEKEFSENLYFNNVNVVDNFVQMNSD